MKNLIKIEFYKLLHGKSKYILLISFSFMFLAPIIILKFSNPLLTNKDFFSNLSLFYNISYNLLLPISVGIFTLSSICNEYKDKPIKTLLMSKYPRSLILIAKYITLFISCIIVYICTVAPYSLIAYFLSNKSPIYFNYKLATVSQVIINLIEYNFMIIFYISTIIAFCIMLGLIFKKQSISVILYIITITFISTLFNYLENKGVLVRQYTFVALSNLDFLGIPGYTYLKLKSIIPAFSNVFLFLGISTIVFDKYEY